MKAKIMDQSKTSSFNQESSASQIIAWFSIADIHIPLNSVSALVRFIIKCKKRNSHRNKQDIFIGNSIEIFIADGEVSSNRTKRANLWLSRKLK